MAFQRRLLRVKTEIYEYPADVDTSSAVPPNTSAEADHFKDGGDQLDTSMDGAGLTHSAESHI